MLADPFFVAMAILSVVIIGFAKGGFSGLGMLATPVLALAISPVKAAAIILPILIVQDIVSVWAYRHSWNRRIVAIMLPGALVGIFIGWLFAARLPVTAVMGVLGTIALLFGLWRLWIERGGRMVAATSPRAWVGTLFGVATGFTSQVAHAGSPPFQIWVAPQKLPHTELVGTNAVLFMAMNLAKLPAYAALGQFSSENLITSAILIPVATIATFAGIWVVARMHGRIFYTMAYGLMVVLGVKLLWDAFNMG